MTMLDYNEADNAATDAEFAAASQPAGFGGQARRWSRRLAPEKPVIITSDAEFEALRPGQKFIGPDRQERVKPFTVKNDIEFEQVPEGAQFIDPTGELRQKPKFEGIGYSAQTLHSMALTDREKRKILEKFYPGQVHGEGENLHVIDENGVYRKPGRLSDVRDAMGVVAGNIAPIGLGAVGSLVGAAGGSAVAPGPGSFGGGVAGGALGGLAGQTFNDIILQLNGVYDRTPGENALDKSVGVVASAGGDLAARGAAAFVPSVKAGVSKATHAASDLANKMLGTNADDLARARRLSELGEGEKPGLGPLAGSSTSPGSSTFAPGAPYLQMLQETMHEKFTTSGTRRRAAERAYEKEVDPLIESMVAGKQIGVTPRVPQSVLSAFPDLPVSQGGGIGLNSFSTAERDALREAGLVQRFTNDAGETYEGVSAQRLWELRDAARSGQSVDDIVGPPTKESVRRTTENITDDLISPPAATSSREAGERLQARALQDAQVLDQRFAEELARRQREIEVGIAPQTAQREQIDRIAQERHRNASQLIDAALQDVERNADEAIRAAAEGSNSGDLWERVGRQLLAVKQGISARYGRNVQEAAQTVPNGARIRIEPIVNSAEEFMARMPEEFERRNPALVQRIRAMGRRPNPDFDPKAGVGERFLPPRPMSIDELHQLRTDLRDVSDYYDLPSDFKNYATKSFAGQVDGLMRSVENTPQFRTAMRLLDENDAWYARERPIFNAREMKTIVRGLESGEPADPEQLFKALVKPGHTDLVARAQQVVGPNLWSGVQAAQRNAWLRAARKDQFDNSVDATAFAKKIIEAHNDGPNGGTLFAVQGRERGAQLLQLARQIGALDGSLPVTFRPNDPAFEVFRQANLAMQQAQREAAIDPMAVLSRETSRIRREVAREQAAARRNDPLRFLYDKSYGATQAVDKILGNEDLILATANRFGEHSPEFNALRQVWIERVFKGNMNPGRELGKATPEVQRLMMGVNMETARKIAEDMEFIMGTKALRGGGDDGGQSIAAASKLTHPVGGKTMSRIARLVPGTNTVARATLQAYYETVDKILSSPSVLRWLEKSYSGGAEQRAAIRQVLSQQLQRAGAMGTGAGIGLYEVGGERLSLPQ